VIKLKKVTSDSEERKMKSQLTVLSVLAAVLTACSVCKATTVTWSGTATGYYQNNTDYYFNPNTDGTTISGTIDVTGMAVGDVEMFGLVDKKHKDNGGSVWQSGAYIYIYKMASGVKIGTSDGNVGGELTTNATNVGAVNVIDFSMLIQNGSMDLTSSLFAGTKTTPYGAVKTYYAPAYECNEFEYGAYLGGCVWPSSTVTYTATNAVPEPATMVLLGLGGLLCRKLRRA
jgi:hypothetical protein